MVKSSGKNRTRYTHQPRDFKGTGTIKCGVCGEPITEHASMGFCKGKQPAKGK